MPHSQSSLRPRRDASSVSSSGKGPDLVILLLWLAYASQLQTGLGSHVMRVSGKDCR